MDCKNCKHWHNQQRELNYSGNYGLCLCPRMKFNTVDGHLAGVIDRQNYRDRTAITGNPSHDFETSTGFSGIDHSRYGFATSEDYGCKLGEPKEKKK